MTNSYQSFVALAATYQEENSVHKVKFMQHFAAGYLSLSVADVQRNSLPCIKVSAVILSDQFCYQPALCAASKLAVDRP